MLTAASGLLLKGVVSEALNEGQEAESASWCGRIFKHWTIPLFGIAALVGAVVFSVGYFLGSYMELVVKGVVFSFSSAPMLIGSMMVATSLLAIYYINKFGVSHSLETSARHLEDTARELEELKTKFSKKSADFNRLNKELDQVRANLEKETKKAINSQENFKRTLQSLNRTKEGFKEKCTLLGAGINRVKVIAEGIHSETEQFQKTNQDLSGNVRELDEQTNELDFLLEGFDENTQQVELIENEIRKELQEISVEIDQLEEGGKVLDREIGILAKTKDRLEQDSHTIKVSSQRLDETSKELERTKCDLEALKGNFDRMQEQLKEAASQFDRSINHRICEQISSDVQALFRALAQFEKGLEKNPVLLEEERATISSNCQKVQKITSSIEELIDLLKLWLKGQE